MEKLGTICKILISQHRLRLIKIYVFYRIQATPAYYQFARDCVTALLNGKFSQAKKIIFMLKRRSDLGAEKIISRKYKFLWLCNPKVASRSIIKTLREIDPDVEIMYDKDIRYIYAVYPEVKDYYSFAFIRHPVHRTYSFYTDKYIKVADEAYSYCIKPYYGVSKTTRFNEICLWLNTPYGSDVVADRHWMSQNIQIRLADGSLPDFIGCYERINADWKKICTHLGMPIHDLPWLNETSQLKTKADLNNQNKALLKTRYADDLNLWNSLRN